MAEVGDISSEMAKAQTQSPSPASAGSKRGKDKDKGKSKKIVSTYAMSHCMSYCLGSKKKYNLKM